MLDEGYLLGQNMHVLPSLSLCVCARARARCACVCVRARACDSVRERGRMCIGRRRYACSARQAQRQQVRSATICERANNIAQHRSRQVEQTHLETPRNLSRNGVRASHSEAAWRPARPSRSVAPDGGTDLPTAQAVRSGSRAHHARARCGRCVRRVNQTPL